MLIFKIVVILTILPLSFIVVLIAITFLLAAITWIRQLISIKLDNTRTTRVGSSKGQSALCWSAVNTALYCGRVAHTRFEPVIHSFSYPLFFCLVDLSEVDILFGNEKEFHSDGSGVRGNGSDGAGMLWPLNILMTFRDEDHLKNGEGLLMSSSSSSDSHCPSDEKDDDDGNKLPCRLRRLVSERTNGKCNPSSEQKILLLTHLSYYGYCFNPVSFYYILKEGKEFGNSDGTENNIEAIVAEVSNTPWNEMKCYVLHPDSCDMRIVKEGRLRKSNEKTLQREDDSNHTTKESEEKNNDWKSINYIFQKKFHVSPFMEMDYMYDWTFWHMIRERIVVYTQMIKQENEGKIEKTNDVKGGTKCFSASFDIRRSEFHPFGLCYQLVKFPIYCFIIQIWIHVEALKLFIKGVQFIPHPEGAETKASIVIGAIMEPIFALKDRLSSRHEKNKID